MVVTTGPLTVAMTSSSSRDSGLRNPRPHERDQRAGRPAHTQLPGGAVREDPRVLGSKTPRGFDRPTDLDFGPDGRIYVVEFGNDRIQVFAPLGGATLPVLAHRSRDEAGRSAQHDSALGDLRLLGRYTFFADDYAPLATRRVALIGGVKFPTGNDDFGTPSFDPVLGAVATWAHDRHEIDLDVLYRIGTERHDFDTGDTLRYDLAYRYRLWPRRFEGRLLQVNGLLELNGTWQAKSRDEGDRLSDTGGSLLFLSPGFQIISTRWIVEASVQIPVHQEMNGSQVKTDVIAVLGVRVPFHVAW